MTADVFATVAEVARAHCQYPYEDGDTVRFLGLEFTVVNLQTNAADYATSSRVDDGADREADQVEWLFADIVDPVNAFIIGTDGRDVISAYAGNDFMCGNGGRDKLFGNRPGDGLQDDSGDVLVGGAGEDRLQSGFGADLLIGGDGDERHFGHQDDDELLDYCELPDPTCDDFEEASR